MTRLTLTQQRALARTIPAHKIALARKQLEKHTMSGGGIGSFFKKVGNTLGDVAKFIGPTVLKEILIPLAKQRLGLAPKLPAVPAVPGGKGLHTAGRGLHPAGRGLKPAGRGKGKKKK